jgi:Putative zinc-finger
MANEWNKTAFVEFETMLRRHLRSGAAPVAACAGFDLDAASAYLEGALGGPHLASYESHLAGCAICRRHLIELARLAQTAPSFEAQPAAEPIRIPARDRLKETVASWFDLSAWNLKWQIAGAIGVAFAILIAALGAQSLYHASNRSVLVSSEASQTSSIAAADLAAQPLPSPTPEPSTGNAAPPAAGELIAGGSVRSAIPAPPQPIGPMADAPKVAFEASSKVLAPSMNEPSEAPTPVKPSGGEATQSPPPQPRALVQRSDLSWGGGSVDFREGPKERAANGATQGPYIVPPPYRADFVGGSQETRLRPQPDRRSMLRVLPEIKIWSLPDLMRRTLGPLSKSDSDTESERKAKSDKPEASDEGTPKPMLVMIRGKVFDFKKGMLIDREYKPEMQKWNVWTLKQGSEQYKRALAAEPLLKEFFDQAPILIVWGDRIYKVLK